MASVLQWQQQPIILVWLFMTVCPDMNSIPLQGPSAIARKHHIFIDICGSEALQAIPALLSVRRLSDRLAVQGAQLHSSQFNWSRMVRPALDDSVHVYMYMTSFQMWMAS